MRWKRFLFDGEILGLMGFTILTKPIALITQMLVASFFGAGHQLDAFGFSFFPVNFLSTTLGRVFSSVAIPQLTKVRKARGPEEVDAYQAALVLLFLIPVIMGVIYFLVWGDTFIDTVGAKLHPETKQYAYRMLRFLALPSLLPCLVLFQSSLLNLNKHFRIPALMTPLNAVITLLCLVLFHERIGIWALPVGYAVSNLMQAPIVLGYALAKKVIRFARPSLSRTDMQRIWALSWMTFTTQALLMSNAFMDKWFATDLEVGSISSINYSLTLINFGVQIFSLSLVVVMFTKMSEFLAADRFEECDTYIQSHLVRVVHLVVPASLGLVAISPEVVRILLQRGAFDAADAVRTYSALSMYLLGLPALVINGIVTKIFQSLQRLKAKIFLALQYLLTNTIGNFLLVKSLQVMGLAVSSSIAINLHLLLSLYILHRFRNRLRVGSYAAIIGRAYLMGAITWVAYRFTGLEPVLDSIATRDTLLGAAVLAAVKFAAIIGIYGVQAVFWLKVLRRRR